MKKWQKLLIDPASYTLLKQLDKYKTKKELSNSTGIKEERTQKLLEKLEEQNLTTSKTTGKTKKHGLKPKKEKIKQLRLEIEEHSTLEIENKVKKQKYLKARKEIHKKPVIENLQKRKTLAKIEALQKINQLPETKQRKQKPTLLQSLKKLKPGK